MMTEPAHNRRSPRAKPTTLARMLILNGARTVLAEQAAVYGASRAS